jgi:hypothetical protein
VTTYNVGDSLPFAVEIRDSTGALANATTVTLTITEADGTVGSPITVSATSTGVYSYPYTATLPGYVRGHWQATGTNSGSEYQTFAVEGAPPVVTLAEAKVHAGIIGTSDDQRAQVFLDAAVKVVEDEAGAIVQRTVTNEFHDAGSAFVWLDVAPVQSVTSVYEGTTALTARTIGSTDNGYVVENSTTGRIARTGLTHFADRVRVTYVVGRSTPSASVRFAVLDAFKYLWSQSTGSSGEAFGGPAAAAGVSAAYRTRLRLLLGNECLASGGFG